jgi:hypothetical protein
MIWFCCIYFQNIFAEDIRDSISLKTIDNDDNLIRCSSGEFILNTFICDGITDCSSGEDEHNCCKSSIRLKNIYNFDYTQITFAPSALILKNFDMKFTTFIIHVIYRITAILTVGKDNITSITGSSIGAAMQEIIYVETFKTNVNVFTGKFI